MPTLAQPPRAAVRAPPAVVPQAGQIHVNWTSPPSIGWSHENGAVPVTRICARHAARRAGSVPAAALEQAMARQ